MAVFVWSSQSNQSMRIALVSSLFPPYSIGGAEAMAARLALALRAEGHEVAVVSTGAASERTRAGYRLDNWEGLPVWRIAPRNFYWIYDKPRLQPNGLMRAAWHFVDLWNPSVLAPLREVFRRIQPDVVNTHNVDGISPVVWSVAGESTTAIAHSLHDCHLICTHAVLRRRDGTICESLCTTCRLYASYHALFQTHVRTLIAPTHAIADLHRSHGWTAPRIEVIPNSVEAPSTSEPVIPGDGPLRILFLSRLEHEKGCQTLLSVIADYHGRTDMEFHIAGRGSCADQFAQVADSHWNVKWHGFVDGARKQHLLSSSDVFLQLSECYDAAPLGLLEALSVGLHIVGTQIGGIPELLAGAGQLIHPGDAQSLGAILSDLAACKERLRDKRAQRIVSAARFGPREMATEYLRVFSSLVTSAR